MCSSDLFQGLFLPETKYDISDNINLIDLIALSVSLQCSEDSVGGRLTLSSSTSAIPFSQDAHHVAVGED